jgi:hypothetical protein
VQDTTAAPEASAIADKDDLFPKRAPKRKELALPDLGRTVLLEALRPKDYEEVNHAAVSYDNGVPKLDNRLWNARMIASALRRPNGTKMYTDEASWRVLSIQIAENWSIGDVQLAAEAVADLSGISKKARAAMEEALGNGSSETATAT